MTFLLEMKEKMRKFYIICSEWLLPILKFALAMLVFWTINNSIGFLPVFKNIFLMLIMALICALLSVKMIAIFAGIMILGHCYALGIEVAGIAACVFVLLFIFAVRFVEKDALALIVTPLAYGLGLPCAIPICYGLKSKPYSAISVCCGTFVYYLISMVKEKASVLQGLEKSNLAANTRMLLDGILKNKMMILSMAVMALLVILVYAIRRLSVDHAWSIATIVGAACYAALMIAGGMFLDIEIPVAALIINVVGSVVIGIILAYFVFNVDYSRVERLQYEDDEYYYYVKAVPKMTIGASQKMVKTIVMEPGENILGDNREATEYDESDLERKLEESLKEL